MNALLTALTIITFSVCGPGKVTIDEKLTIKKNTKIHNDTSIVYKKILQQACSTPLYSWLMVGLFRYCNINYFWPVASIEERTY